MDQELRDQLQTINKKLDEIKQNPSEKNKTSRWKQLTIGIPVAVALIGLLGTGYELGLRFLESQSNRQTIQFYTALAKTLVENGNYEAAEVYLIEAEEIDASNADVVSTKAFVDMMELIKRSVKTNSQELANATYNLRKLNLYDDEVFYHIGTVASQAGHPDISEEYFLRIPEAPNRYSLRARARLINDVYLRSLDGGVKLSRPNEEILDSTLAMLPNFIRDVMHYTGDHELTGNLMQHLYAFGYALLIKLPSERLPELRDSFAQINDPDTDFIATLDARSRDAGNLLEQLEVAQENINPSSPASEQINAAINQYSAQVESEKEITVVANRRNFEQQRKDGMNLSKKGQYKAAEEIFHNIVTEYERQNWSADATLFKTYFDLGLHYEYQLGEPLNAIPYYEKAEKLAGTLDLKDPSIYNTFGYLFYKLGRDAVAKEDKQRYLNEARNKLNIALEIAPDYNKSQRTLAAVESEFEKLEQVAYYKEQIQRMPQKKMSALR